MCCARVFLSFVFSIIFFVVISPNWAYGSPSRFSRSLDRNAKVNNYHAFENGPYYQGDILGFGDHVIQGSDGTMRHQTNLWPLGIVPYTIEDSYDDDQMEMIHSVIKNYNKRTCLRFIKRTKEKKYIHIVNKPDCASYVGVDDTQPQEVDIGIKQGCVRKNTITHELMHAIGFIHEHVRPDRNKYVMVKWENIDDEKKRFNFEIDSKHFMDVGFPYDINSIMQYDSETHAIEPEKNHPTILTRKGQRIKEALDFSKTDLQEINKVYKKECAKRSGNGK